MKNLHLLVPPTCGSALLTGAVVLLCLSSTIGCGGTDPAPDPLDLPIGHAGQPNTPDLMPGSCEEGVADRECKVYFEQANGVTSCFTGFQYCNAGQWSECLDPDHDPRVE